MKNLYSVDLLFFGTLYVKAESKEKALELARTAKNDTIEVMPGPAGDMEISGAPLDQIDHDASLSPVFTCHGPVGNHVELQEENI
jgi:hypothetical protein